jgi:hypothetical protein
MDLTSDNDADATDNHKEELNYFGDLFVNK